MSVTITLIKRSGQNSPITPTEFDYNMSAIEAAFASLNNASGSVTSVGLSAPNIFTVGSSPVTSSGNITLTLANQTANKVWASATSGGSAAPTFRALVSADLPTIPISKGGTGNTSFTNSRVIVSDGSGNLTASSVSSTEVGYLYGVTSAIQTQINAKQDTITVLAVNKGGTGANTAQGARVSLLPSLTGNALKYLRANAGETDVEWATPASSVSSVNALTGALTITKASTGTDFDITSAGTTITISIPDASATARGLINATTQSIEGQKTFLAAPIIDTGAATLIPFLGGSKEVTTSANLFYEDSTGELNSKVVKETLVTTITADQVLDLTYNYVRVRATSALLVTLPSLNSTMVGRNFWIKDTAYNAATYNITVQSQGGDELDGSVGGTKVINTNGGCLCVMASTNGTGTFFWEVKSLYKSS